MPKAWHAHGNIMYRGSTFLPRISRSGEGRRIAVSQLLSLSWQKRLAYTACASHTRHEEAGAHVGKGGQSDRHPKVNEETAMTIASDLLQRHIHTLVADNGQWQTLIADDLLWELPYAPALAIRRGSRDGRRWYAT